MAECSAGIVLHTIYEMKKDTWHHMATWHSHLRNKKISYSLRRFVCFVIGFSPFCIVFRYTIRCSFRSRTISTRHRTSGRRDFFIGHHVGWGWSCNRKSDVVSGLTDIGLNVFGLNVTGFSFGLLVLPFKFFWEEHCGITIPNNSDSLLSTLFYQTDIKTVVLLPEMILFSGINWMNNWMYNR